MNPLLTQTILLLKKIFSVPLQAALVSMLLLGTSVAHSQPVNNYCFGAVPIVPHPEGTVCSEALATTLPFATDGTTDSGVPSNCYPSGRDQWFTWTATSDALLFSSYLPGNPGIAVFANCADASNGYEMDCAPDYSENEMLSGWEIGDQIILQVFDYPNTASSVAFCLTEYNFPPPPVNDICSGATPITLSSSGMACNVPDFVLPFDFDGTTASGLPNFCTTTGNDQWFSWTATTNRLLFSSQSPGNPGISIFSSCATATSGNSIDCSILGDSYEILSGWEIGDELIIRIYDGVNHQSNVAFCLQTLSAPPNDFCAGAIPIVPTETSSVCEDPFYIPFTYDGTTDSGVPSVCTPSGNDQWFSWTATKTHLLFDSFWPGRPGIAIFANCTDAEAGNDIICTNTNANNQNLSGWSIGDELIIQVYDNSGSTSNVQFCLEAYNPPPNDFCSGAIPITPSPPGTGCSSPSFNFPFPTDYTTDSGVPNTCSINGKDQWFTWTATEEGLLFRSQSPGHPGIAIFANCIDAQSGYEIDCANPNDSYELLSGWEIGDELLLQIYDHGSSTSDVAFCLETYTPPPNDFCSGAIPITPSASGDNCANEFLLPFSTDYTTASDVPNNCSNSGKDQWFTWTATEEGLLFSSQSPGNPGIAIFANCANAQSGFEIDCANLNDNYEILRGWEIGDELLIQIYDYYYANTSDVAFCLETFTLPPNDFCSGAIPISPLPWNTGCSGDNIFNLPFGSDGTSDSGVPDVCSFSNIDQWFTWTATETRLVFRSISPGYPGIAVFANCADADTGNDIDCANVSDSYEELTGWAIGDELLIQIYDYSSNVSDVAFCLEAYSPPPNDFCSGAIPITPSPAGTECNTTTYTLPFDTDGTTDSGVPSNCSISGKDQWFTWTATEGGLLFSSASPGYPGIAVFASCTDANAGNELACITPGQVNASLSGWGVGDELLLQIYDYGSSTSTVAFCLETFSTPANNICSGAIPITPSPSGTGCSSPAFTLPFATDNTTDSGVPNTCSFNGKDQWFTWTATTNGLLFDSESPGYPGIAIFNNCTDASTGNEIDCASPGAGSTVLRGWEIGDELLIQIYDQIYNTADVAFCLETYTVPPPPVNDLCSGAIPIVPSPSGTGCNASSTFTLPFSSDGTSDSGVPTVCSTPGNDQWFTWTATEVGLIFRSQYPGSPGIAIFANCTDANAGIDIDCASAGNSYEKLTGWEIGDELLIQIYDFTGHDSDIAFCLETFSPPVNDFCIGAIPFTPAAPGTGCNNGVVFELPFASDHTTDSGVPSVCSNSRRDQWFTWTASTDGLIFQTWWPGEPGIAIYANCADAQSGNDIICASSGGGGPTILDGWAVGDELIIQIYNSSYGASDVAFCLETFTIPTPPINDFCSGAIPIVPSPSGTGCNSSSTFSLPFFYDGTTDSGVPAVCSTPAQDQWFTWTATEGGLLFRTQSPGYPGIAIYANCTDANSGIEIDCANAGDSFERLNGWEIGDELLIQIYDNSYINSDVAFCLETYTPPPNDFCSGAIPIVPSAPQTACENGPTFTFPFSTDNTSDSGVPTVCSTPGNDQWFTWTASTDALVFDSEWPGYPGIAIYANCADANSGNDIVCTTDGAGPIILNGWAIGDELLIQIYDRSGQNSDVAFCLEMHTISGPPPNDFCSGAIPIVPNAMGTGCTSDATFTLPFFYDGTTDSGVPRVCSTPGKDQWFTWTATEPGLQFSATSPGNPGIAIYANCTDASAGNEIDCANVNDNLEKLSGWEIGEELLIQIYDGSGQNANVAFCLESFTPPPNDLCSGAIPINPQPNGSTCSSSFTLPFSTDGTTDSGTPTVCHYNGNDQWFTWTATELGLLFSSLYPGNPGITIYANCADANAGIAIDCVGDYLYNEKLTGWEIGDELLIHIYDGDSGNSDVSFCLETFTPPPNDLCSGAIPITPQPSSSSCSSSFTLPFSTDGTTDSGTPTVCHYNGNDQWFTWTATELGLLFSSLYPGYPGITIYANCADANAGVAIECVGDYQYNEKLSGWELGDELLIHIYDGGSGNSDVSFCLETFTPPVNNICSGAIPIVPNAEDTGCSSDVTFTLPFSTDGTTASGISNNCTSFSGNDQWFTWTATAAGLLFDSRYPGYPGIAIYANCANTEAGMALACNTGSGSQTLAGWEIGDELLIQIYDIGSNNSDVAFCLETFTPSVNNICSGAIPIVPNPEGTGCSTNTTFTLPFSSDNTSDSGVPDNCSLSGNDQWFTWTATAEGLLFNSQSPGYPGIAIFANCGNATAGLEIACANAGDGYEQLVGWEIGDELLIQIYDYTYSISDVAFCLETFSPPVNNICSGAIPIVPNENGTGCSNNVAFTLPFATDNTTDSGVPNVCSVSGRDQWFTWTATDLGLLFSSRSPGYPGIAVFANCADANAGNAIACTGPASYSAGLSGWEMGDELLIQIYDYGTSTSNVAFCLETFTPPANDYCIGALPIVPNPAGTGCNANTSFSLPFATDGTTDSGIPTVCSTSGKDQWFTWTATDLELAFSSRSPGYPGIAIFANCADANAGIEIDCANTSDSYERLSGWAIGDELLIQVYDHGSGTSNVAFCLEIYEPLANDFCAGATPIVPNPSGTGCNSNSLFNLPFASDGTTDSGVPNTCSINGKDQWFTWTATESSLLFRSQWPGYPGIAIFANCSDASSGNEIACASPGDSYEILSGWEVGDELLIQIYDYSTSNSDVSFCLEVFATPPNDLCSGATPIVPHPSGTGCSTDFIFNLPFATDNTTDSGVPNTCSINGKDQWFTWTATESNLLFRSQWPGRPGIAIFANCSDASTGNEIDCASPGDSYEILSGWEVGDELLIQIYDYSTSNSDVSFCLEVFATPPNDLCSGATPIVPHPSGTGCSTGFIFNLPFATDNTTDSGVPNTCSINGKDQWFTWTATDLELLFRSRWPGYPGIAIFDNCTNAASGNEIDCANPGDSYEKLSGWEIGDELLIQIYDYGSSTSSVAFCLEAFMSPPNDYCSGAIPIVPNPTESTCIGDNVFVLPFSTDNTSDSGGPRVCSTSGNDQWFTWTATSLGLRFNSLHPGEPGIAVYDNCSYASDGIEIDCAYTSANDEVLRGWEIGDELLIQVYDGSSSISDVAFCLKEQNPPENDFCENAIELPVDLSENCIKPVEGNNFLASASGVLPEPTCGYFQAGNDVWYHLTVPSSGNVDIEMSYAGPPNPTNWAMAAYTGTCGNLSLLECDDFDGIGSFPALQFENLSPNSDLYIRVWEWGSNSEGAFNICAFGPPCDIAITSTSSTDESCDGAHDGSITVSASTSNPPLEYQISGPSNQTNQTGLFEDLPPGEYTVIASDIIANCADTTTLTIETGIPLIVDCSQITNQDLDCLEDLPAADFDLPIVTSACGTAIVSSADVQSNYSGCPGQAITIERTYTISDDQDTTTCVQLFTFESDAPPTITCPPNTTVSCDMGYSPTTTGMPNASADCSLSVELNFQDYETIPVLCSQEETIERVWMALDECGRMTACTQIIQLIDTVPPEVPLFPADLVLQCADEVPDEMQLVTSDNCAPPVHASPISVRTPGACANEFTITRTWTFDDGCGNVSIKTQIIEVRDTIPPVAPMAPADLLLQCTDEIPIAQPLTASDNCGQEITVLPTEQMSPGICANQFTLVRTWTFEDPCGNSSSTVQIIEIEDTTPPIAPTPPADMVIQCANEIPLETALTALDNCGESITVMPSSTVIPGDCPTRLTLTRTWTFEDNCGNITSVDQQIEVIDNHPIAAIAPPDQVVDCAYNVIATPGLVEVNTPCKSTYEVETLSTNLIEGTANCTNAIYQITYLATDACGRTATATQLFTIENEGPQLIVPASICVMDCPADVDQIWSTFNAYASVATVSTSCSNLEPFIYNDFHPDNFIDVDCNNNIFAIPNVIEYQMVTFYATDVCGRTSNGTAMVVVKDDHGPEISGEPFSTIRECNDLVQSEYEDWLADNMASLSATDACSEVQWSYSPASPNETIWVNGFATTEVVITASDECGNKVSKSTIFTLKNNFPPTFIGELAEKTVECDSVPLPFDLPEYIHSCGETILTYEDDMTPGQNNNEYSITRTWTVTDHTGSQNTTSQTIVVVDRTGPNVTNAPEDLILTCLEEVPLPSELTVEDNCSGMITATAVDSQTLGNCPNELLILRTWTFTDESGNTTELSQNIIVNDEVAPFFASVPLTQQQACGTTPQFGNPVVKDNCEAPINLSWEDTTGGDACSGFATRTWVATDACGNSSTTSQIIEFKDQEGPVFYDVPANQSINCDEFPPSFNVPLVEDACNNSFDLTYEEAYLSGGPNSCLLGEDLVFQRVWIATDACGNVSTAKQVFDVRSNVGNSSTRNQPEQIDPSSAPVFKLLQNQPNPFRQETTIGFILPQASDATLSVFDLSGRLVAQVKGSFKQGFNEIEFSRSDLGGAGAYYYQLDTPKHTATKKLIIY